VRSVLSWKRMETQGKSDSVLSATFSTVRPLTSGNCTTREYEVLRCLGAAGLLWRFCRLFLRDAVASFLVHWHTLSHLLNILSNISAKSARNGNSQNCASETTRGAGRIDSARLCQEIGRFRWLGGPVDHWTGKYDLGDACEDQPRLARYAIATPG
jgi:hypothetical protein